MKIAGIICEYNPFHLGHAGHIDKTRAALGGDCAIVCVMSGNFVQRGDFAVFNKHARAKSAVLCGADLVLELPAPYSLTSAEGFAAAGVYILDRLGICEYISFGSESGDICALTNAAKAIESEEAATALRDWLDKGVSYATAQQKAADAVMGADAEVFKSPNNLLGIEYIKAISSSGSPLRTITIKRTGGAHDSDFGYSASGVRKLLLSREIPAEVWSLMPVRAAGVYNAEIAAGRGPVSMKNAELALLSRLRASKDLSDIPGAAEGLERRLMRYAYSEPTVAAILEKVKTRRYTMSRLRRMLLCACLGVSAKDTESPPPYIRVLAMNQTGMGLLREAREKARLPVITKPASARKLTGNAADIFSKEAAFTDLYVLAYQEESNRGGGQEWRQTPVMIENRG